MNLLMDSVNLCYRGLAYNFTTSAGYPTNVIYGMMVTLKNLFNRFGVVPVAVWEGSSQNRKLILPTYKSGRKSDQNVMGQSKDVMELYSLFGVRQVYHPEWECDDTISCLCRRFLSENQQVVIISSDADMYQLVTENSFVYDMVTGNFKTVKYIIEKLGVHPSRIAFYKSIVGDVSDRIKGIERIRKKVAAGLVNKFEDPYDMYVRFHEIEDLKLRERVMSYKDVVLRNYRIIKLDHDFTPVEIERRPDLNRVRELFTKYEFRSFLNEFSVWERIFHSP